MSDPIIEIDINSEEIQQEIRFLRNHMSETQFKRAMYGVFRDTSRHVSSILRKDLPKQYHVKSSEVRTTVKSPKLNFNGPSVGCVIPLRGPRKKIGTGFTATGSARGWESRRKKYRVKARIVKSGTSTLPASMDDYGGMPPFRNIPSKLGKATFTRTGKVRLPIKVVTGISIPQMPMNRSRADVEKDITDYLIGRLTARITALLSRGV